jgi:CelD/BcsL family acetyltransferase involved in cellulose biosynthesis
MNGTIISGADVFSAPATGSPLSLASEWDALAMRGMTDTPFQSLAYQRAWWTHLHPPDSELITVATRDASGALAGICCCFLTADGTLRFNGCVEETDYLDLIATADQAPAVWEAVFDCLHSHEASPWDRMDLCNVPEQSPTRQILARLATRHGLEFQEQVHDVCPVISLPDSFENYLESLESKQRREIQRKLRRANGAEARLREVGPEDDLRAEVDTFLDLLQRSAYDKRDWLNEGRRAVFHEVAEAAMANGTLQLLFSEVSGRAGAALFNFDYRGRTWVYNSGLEPDGFAALSLGVVLTAQAIELAIARGNHTFDFLRGNETYKYRFGAMDSRVYRLLLARIQV